MRYLENEDLVHRDLAARNVLLDRNGVAKVVIGIDIAAQNIITLFCPRKKTANYSLQGCRFWPLQRKRRCD